MTRRPGRCCGDAGRARPGSSACANSGGAAARSWAGAAGPSCSSSTRRSRWRRDTARVFSAGATRRRRFATRGALGGAARLPRAAAIDAVLHAERLDHGRQRRHALPAGTGGLPDGTVIAAAGGAYTLAHGRAFRWTAGGYEAPVEIPRAGALLTPPSTLRALRAGYRPALHPGVADASCVRIDPPLSRHGRA
jgi:hypothetical protein